MPPPPRLHKHILVMHSIFFVFWPIIREQIRNLEKKTFHLFVELVEPKPLMCDMKDLR